MDKQYKIVDGTYYDARTPDAVISVLEMSRKTKTRLRLDYGDTNTGQSWGEQYDILGHIGRSTGSIKIPLLIHNSRSIGGGGILDYCIIKISESKGGRVLYRDENYKPYSPCIDANNILKEQYPIQDETWPSRRWNVTHTDYADMSGC